MAQPNINPTVCVIGSQFIAPYPLEVNVLTNSRGTLVITDVNNKVLLKVIPCDTFSTRQRLLMDANDTPIVTLQEDGWSFHQRWSVYKGKSTAKSDMIFTSKLKHASTLFKSRVNVYLAHKMSSNDAYDFKIKGKWHKRSCAIYKGYSSTPLAQMHTMQQLQKEKLPKDKFMVTINPNVDYAFVVALITIADAIENPYKTKGLAAGETSAGVAGALLELVGGLSGGS